MQATKKRQGRSIATIGVFGLICGVIVWMAYVSYDSEALQLRREIGARLQVVAALKVRQLEEWRRERLWDAQEVLQDAMMHPAVQKVIEGRASPAEIGQVQTWLDGMCTRQGYANAVLTDAEGRVMLRAGQVVGAEQHLRSLAQAVMRRGQIELRDFHLDEDGGKVHLGLNTPLAAPGGGKPIGALLLAIDPQSYLYPMLQRWPGISASAETLLVRRENGTFVFLNELRHRKGTAMRLRLPMSDQSVAAAQLLRGRTGVFEALDYRGVPVLAAGLAVPGTDWLLESKMDLAEADAPLRERSAQLVILVGALMLAVAAGFGLFWRQQQARYYRREYEAERERRELADRLREMSEYVKGVVEASPAAIVALDRQGLVRLWNRAAEKMFGWTAAEVEGKALPYVPPGKEEESLRLQEAVYRGQVPTEIELDRIRKDGTPIKVSLSIAPLRNPEGELAGQIGVLVDVTERKRAEEALKESEVLFRATFEQAAVGMAHVALDGRFLMVNERLCQITGRPREELLGMTFQSITHPDDGAQDLEQARRLLAGEIPTASVEKRYLRPDGSVVWVNVTRSLRRAASGKPLHFMGVVEDITQRMEAEAEKRKLSEQLLQAQKVESVGRLAGGLAHDFNNHLTVIQGYCELMLMKLGARDPLRDQVAQVRRASEQAAALTQQLLAFSRKQVLHSRPVNLNDVMLENRTMLERLIGENIRLDTLLDPELGVTVTDPGQIAQVLMNLLTNARDAMPNGGRVVIETANVDLDENYAAHHPEMSAGSYVLLAVTDTGDGMDEETRRRIFEPFYTTKEKGTGLGLATVYGIVRQSGGFIWVYSEPSKGSTFKVYMPRVAQEAQKTVAALASPSQLEGEETVLVVEDQEEVRRLTTLVLRSYGYEVLEASSGEDALEVASARPERIDLLITDVVMPGMTGRELATKLAEVRPGMQVLFVSGYTANVIVHRGVLDPGVNYLSKPFTPQILAEKVREVLGAPAA